MKLYVKIMSIRFSILLCFLSTAACFSASQASWVEAATDELSEVLQTPVSFVQSGPQNVFYVQNLLLDGKQEIIEVLDKYRSEITAGGAIVLVGLTSKVAYRVTTTAEAQVLTNTTMADFYVSLVDGRNSTEEPQEVATEPKQVPQSYIIGSNRARVNQLLNNWVSEPSEVNASNINYYDPDETVKLTISFASNNEAVAVSVVNLYGIPISESRVNQLLNIIGGPSPDIVRYGGDIVEFYVGDANLY